MVPGAAERAFPNGLRADRDIAISNEAPAQADRDQDRAVLPFHRSRRWWHLEGSLAASSRNTLSGSLQQLAPLRAIGFNRQEAESKNRGRDPKEIPAGPAARKDETHMVILCIS